MYTLVSKQSKNEKSTWALHGALLCMGAYSCIYAGKEEQLTGGDVMIAKGKTVRLFDDDSDTDSMRSATVRAMVQVRAGVAAPVVEGFDASTHVDTGAESIARTIAITRALDAQAKKDAHDNESVAIEECVICFYALTTGEVTALECSGGAGKVHMFHTECLDMWKRKRISMNKKEKCPTCMVPIPTPATVITPSSKVKKGWFARLFGCAKYQGVR